MIESILRKKLFTNLEKLEKKLFIRRVEQYSFPDLFYALKNMEGWIELKQFEKSLDDFIKIPFRVGQLVWLENYLKINGNYFLFGTFEEKLYILRGEDLSGTIYTREYINKCSIAIYTIDNIDYTEIISILNGEYPF